MLRLLFVTVAVFLLPSCTPSTADNCAVVCEKSALCNPGSDEKVCVSLCNELAADDQDYANALVTQAECYEENASYYDDPTGVCLAIEGGACRVEPE